MKDALEAWCVLPALSICSEADILVKNCGVEVLPREKSCSHLIKQGSQSNGEGSLPKSGSCKFIGKHEVWVREVDFQALRAFRHVRPPQDATYTGRNSSNIILMSSSASTALIFVNKGQ